ncbi:hypothetical protein K1719_035065 [Acacia pycnantha]|nr:hypothetical protein K1719_035065 [Acacia pycnantha]
MKRYRVQQKRWISDMEIFGLTDTYRIFSAAGSPRFEVYNSDFGWGRPKKVEIVPIDNTGAFSLRIVGMVMEADVDGEVVVDSTGEVEKLTMLTQIMEGEDIEEGEMRGEGMYRKR